MATASDFGFETYAGFRPTGFDHHICIEDERESWALMPVARNRDSNVLDNCNFDEFLEGLGGESDTVEVHRFGHWGCGWFEIIIVDPNDDAAINKAYEMAGALQDYPVLNEEKLSEMELEEAGESWDSWARRDLERLVEHYLERHHQWDDDKEDYYDELAEKLVQQWEEENGFPEYETHSYGTSFNLEAFAKEIMKDYDA